MQLQPRTNALLAGAGLLFAAGGMHGLVLPLRGDIEGFDTGLIGLIGSAHALGHVLGCLVAPWLVGRAGHVRTFGALAAMVAIVALLHALLVMPGPWLVLRAATGFAFAGTTMIIESWLNEAAGGARRGQIFARYMMINLAGSMIGQMAVAGTGVRGFEPFAWIAILACMALLPTALSNQPSPQPLARARLDLGMLFRVSPIAAVGCLAIGLANGAFGSLAAVWARAQGLEVAAVATFVTATIAGGALAQLPVGRISDRMDRRWILIAGCLAAGAASLVLLLQPQGAIAGPAIIGFGLCLGASMHTLYPLAVAHANDLARPEDFVGVGSGLLLLFGIGAALGPALASLAMSSIGPEGLFAHLLVVYGALALFGALRILIRRPQAPEGAGFLEMPLPKTVTPETASLDPRHA
jgi:MFS family permease